MENYSYSSYPDSGDSSPRSREIDCENASFDEPLPPNYKVKFMCSYGGKIQPRPFDNQLSYVGGDTKIMAVDRHIRFPTLISKLNSLIDTEDPSSICFKYQLPGEDLDALISVTNDEDLEHLMLEYDRLHRASSKPARLRLFLFSVSPPISAPASDPKSDRQWFVDALNSAPTPPPIQSIDVSSPPAAVGTPDFLFGFDKSSAAAAAAAGKLQDQAVESTVVETAPLENLAGSELAKEVAAESAAEIQRQIQDLHRMQIANQEQGVFQRRSDEGLPRAFPGDFYIQKPPEKTVPPPAPAPAPAPAPVPAPATVPVPTAVPQGYWQERQMMQASGYAPAAATGVDQPVYFVSSPAGVYQPAPVRPVTSQVGQGYYVQRMVPDVYREQAVYSMGPPPPAVQKVGPGPYVDGGMGVVRPQVADAGAYAQMAYDSAGRQLYYTTPGGVMPAYQTMAAATTNVDVRQAGGALNPEGKVGKPTTQAS
ncbi:uncharacterized protein LOC131218760 [Magnolia sinica]|uniref:uncharacterized protein LOC131218760 n=1 Tax=Magnolia sinica TaxID=86752 RepID=UPI00265A3160|nr:uncharacterized protein LOC131218760 [Magnolia sinica]